MPCPCDFNPTKHGLHTFFCGLVCNCMQHSNGPFTQPDCFSVFPGAIAMARALCFNSSITCLKLSRNSIGNEGVTEMAKMLRYMCGHKHARSCFMQKLKRLEGVQKGMVKLLYLSHTKLHPDVPDEKRAALPYADSACIFRQNCTLKQLRMSWNTISDDGAHQLAAVLPRNTTLEVLDIADNRC
jgi:hypothetical protein